MSTAINELAESLRRKDMSDTTKPNNGGPAFPAICHLDGLAPVEHLGMTKRELFALGAMVGQLASQNGPLSIWSEKDIANLREGCWRIADAMLEEGEK